MLEALSDILREVDWKLRTGTQALSLHWPDTASLYMSGHVKNTVYAGKIRNKLDCGEEMRQR